jgi:phosphatidylglycerophosphate synthase
MVDVPESHPSQPALAPDAVGAAIAVGLVVLAAALALPFGGAAPAPVAVGLYAAVAAIALTRVGAHRMPRFGAANGVTLFRAGGVAVFAALAAEPAVVAAVGGWALLAVALGLLALDGIDGWLARRQRLETAFGARFDMEVDALFILVLAALAVGLGKAGAWVLALGMMRYGFVAASLAWPWLAAPLPPSLRRKAVCVLQIAVLAALLAPPVAPPVSGALAAAAFAALAWSFAVDVRWLAREGRR